MLEGVNMYARQALNFVCVEAGTTVGQAAHMPQADAARGFGWRIHCGVEVTESSTNTELSLSRKQKGVHDCQLLLCRAEFD